MNNPEAITLLKKRCLRSAIIMKVLFWIMLISTSLLVWHLEFRPWALSSFIIAIIALIGVAKFRQKLEVTLSIIQDPSLIYWVQPRVSSSNLEERTLNGSEALRLFLTNGEYLEIDTPAKEQKQFKEWVKHYNSNARWEDRYENCVD